MNDFLDNRDNIANRKAIVTPEMLSRGSLKGKKCIRLNDAHNTEIYHSPKKDAAEVEFRYRKHLGQI